MSSHPLIKVVAKELNHYFNKVRFEDGFDRSNYNIPQVKHCPRKLKHLVTYTVDYDRDIKHYFSHPEMRIFLTQFENLRDFNSREEILQQALDYYLHKYQVNDGVLKPTIIKRKPKWIVNRIHDCHPRFRNIAHIKYTGRPIPCHRDPSFSYLKYRKEKKEKLLNRKKTPNPPYQCYPVFTNTTNPEISRGHAERLVNIATKMLSSSERIRYKTSRYSTTAPGTKLLFYQPETPIEQQEAVMTHKIQSYHSNSFDKHSSSPKLRIKCEDKPPILVEPSSPVKEVREPIGLFKISRSYRESKDSKEAEFTKSDSKDSIDSESETNKRTLKKADSQNLHNASNIPPTSKSKRQIYRERSQSNRSPLFARQYSPPLDPDEPLPLWLIKELKKCAEDRKQKLKRESTASNERNFEKSCKEMFSDFDSDEVSDLSEFSDEEESRKIRNSSKMCVSEQAQFVHHLPPPSSQTKPSRDRFSRGRPRSSENKSSSNKRSKNRPMSPVEEEKVDKTSIQSKKAAAGLSCSVVVQTDKGLLANYDQSLHYVSEELETIDYQVIVDTGDRLGASTQADVFLTLFGPLGRTREQQLINSHTHKVSFRKGRSDLFTVSYPYVGPLQRIQIGHNDRDPASNWFLESVTIMDNKSRERHYFLCRKWLGGGLGTKQSKAILYPKSTVNISTVENSTDAKDQEYRDNRIEQTQINAECETSQPDVEQQSPRSAAGTFDSILGEVSELSHNLSPEEENLILELKLDSPEDEQEFDSEELEEEYYCSEVNSFDALPNDNAGLAETTNNSNFHRNVPRIDSPNRVVIREPSKLSLHDLSLQGMDTVKLEPRKENGYDQSDVISDRADSSIVSDLEGDSETTGHSSFRTVKIKDPENHSFDLSGAYRNPIKLDPEEEREVEEMIQKRISESFLRGCSVHEAIKFNQYSKVLHLIQMFKQNISEEDEQGYLPTHTACDAGFPDIVELLFHFEGSFDVETPTGYLPVHLSALNGHFEALRTLRRLGISLENSDQQGNTLLHLASRGGHLEVVRWLVEELQMPIDKNSNGETPEEVADIFGFPSVAEYFRSAECKSNNVSQEKLLVYSSLFQDDIPMKNSVKSKKIPKIPFK